MKTILEKFKHLANHKTDEDIGAQWKENLILARLIQFVLSFKCTWSPVSKDISKDLSNVIFDLLLVGYMAFSCPCHTHLNCSIVHAKTIST